MKKMKNLAYRIFLAVPKLLPTFSGAFLGVIGGWAFTTYGSIDSSNSWFLLLFSLAGLAVLVYWSETASVKFRDLDPNRPEDEADFWDRMRLNNFGKPTIINLFLGILLLFVIPVFWIIDSPFSHNQRPRWSTTLTSSFDSTSGQTAIILDREEINSIPILFSSPRRVSIDSISTLTLIDITPNVSDTSIIWYVRVPKNRERTLYYTALEASTQWVWHVTAESVREDTNAPEPPDTIRYTWSQSPTSRRLLSLTWTPSKAKDVSSYRVYLNRVDDNMQRTILEDVVLHDTLSCSFEVADSALYEVSLQAIDESGNKSRLSLKAVYW